MRKRLARERAADLVDAFAKSREIFMDAATNWIRERQRFLIRTGKQPKPEKRSDKRDDSRSR